MLVYSPEAYDTVIGHALSGTPNEICGILGGTNTTPDTATVQSVHKAPNAADHPQTEYRIDPETQYELIETIESTDQEVIGFYHSHPTGPPRPSHTDIERATWPGLSYSIVILSGRHPFIGSWRWNDSTDTFNQEIVTLSAP